MLLRCSRAQPSACPGLGAERRRRGRSPPAGPGPDPVVARRCSTVVDPRSGPRSGVGLNTAPPVEVGCGTGLVLILCLCFKKPMPRNEDEESTNAPDPDPPCTLQKSNGNGGPGRVNPDGQMAPLGGGAARPGWLPPWQRGGRAPPLGASDTRRSMRARTAAIARRRWRHTHGPPGALPPPERAGGGAVATSGRHRSCSSQRGRDAPLAAHTWAARRAPSSSDGWGGRSRRAGGAARARPAAIATRRWRHRYHHAHYSGTDTRPAELRAVLTRRCVRG
jgi:hypothetical protein